jgi:transposase
MLARAHALLQRFHTAIMGSEITALDRWITDALAGTLPAFVALANGLPADRAAVEAAITTRWSTGPVEGHIHKVKLRKRQGYGRAGFALLRQRILVA